jgi:NAD(P)-dependent dehydrogenase (short-subunit alcohol dehydrogenase family)
MANVVIGAASGMGAAVARRLAPRGRLLIADYNLAGVEALAADIANVIAFLTSPEASYMTGSDVLVDGGMVSVLPKGVWDGKIRVPVAA